jgi:cytoskeletal protein CcmA (bactofilin family)
MSQVFDALKKAEQARKNPSQADKQADAAPNSISPENDSSGSTFSCLAAGLEIHGEIRGNQDLLVEGKVDGVISLGNRRLTVGTKACVSAKIVAGEVVVHGQVDGDVRASERIVIKSEGSASGTLTSARILVEDGAYIKAEVQIRSESPALPATPDPASI